MKSRRGYVAIAVLLLAMAVLIQTNARTEYRQGYRVLEAMKRNYEDMKPFHYLVREERPGNKALTTKVWVDPGNNRYRIEGSDGVVRVYRGNTVYTREGGQVVTSPWDGKAPDVGVDHVLGRLSEIKKLSLKREKKGGEVILTGALGNEKWVATINADWYLPGQARVYSGEKLLRTYTFAYVSKDVRQSAFAPLQ